MSQTTDISPGAQKIDDVAYHAMHHCSKHALDVIRERSPGHLWYQRQNPPEPTDAMRFGSALHTYILEREHFAARHPIASQCCSILKSGKNAGQPCRNDASHLHAGAGYCGTHGPEGAVFIPNTLSREDHASILRMSESIERHAAASALLARNDETDENEVAFIADRQVGDYTLRCKAKIDALRIKNWSAIVDIKTCQNASFDSFQRDIDTFGYYRQAAFYFDMADACGIRAENFIFIAVEKAAPYAVAVYSIARDSISVQIGRNENERLMRVYANCERSGFWPFYDDEFKQIELHPAAIRRAMQKD